MVRFIIIFGEAVRQAYGKIYYEYFYRKSVRLMVRFIIYIVDRQFVGLMLRFIINILNFWKSSQPGL